jgi:hypothetical protein
LLSVIELGVGRKVDKGEWEEKNKGSEENNFIIASKFNVFYNFKKQLNLFFSIFFLTFNSPFSHPRSHLMTLSLYNITNIITNVLNLLFPIFSVAHQFELHARDRMKSNNHREIVIGKQM